MPRPVKNYCDYFSHDRDMRNHRKIKAIRTKIGIVGYAIWNMVLEYLTGIDGNQFENSDVEIELMCGDFGVSVAEMRQLLDYCIKLELLFEKDGFIYSKSLDERLNAVYEKRNKNSDRSKQQVRVHGKFAVDNTAGIGVSATEKPQSKVKESKVKEIILIDNGTWESEKAKFLIAEQWQMKQCSEFQISKDELMQSIALFLKDIENTEDFKSEKELKRHWYNWFRKGREKGKSTNGFDYQKDTSDRVKNFQQHVIRD
jgi:hypothetical protein